MLLEAELFQKYNQVGIVQGGELYLTPPQAFDFITSCQENNLAVIGIEGFSYEGKMLKPQLDMIADYSWANARCWIEYRELCNQSAQDFLKHLTPTDGLVISFVVLSEAEWDTVEN